MRFSEYVNFSVYNGLFIFMFVFCQFAVSGISLEENGPRFMEDFARSVIFSSRVGGGIKCRAHGMPKPTIQWITKDFLPVINLTAIRQVILKGQCINRSMFCGESIQGVPMKRVIICRRCSRN